MMSTVPMPHLQMPPPVLASVFAGPVADPAIGRLPYNVVPPPISSAKVADDQRGGAQARAEARAVGLTDKGALGADGAPFTSALDFPSPFSTPFLAQLFGQIGLYHDLAAPFGHGGEVPTGFVDFDRLAEYNTIKYLPSFAFKPREEPKGALQAAQEIRMELPPETDAEMQMIHSSESAISGVGEDWDEEWDDIPSMASTAAETPAALPRGEVAMPSTRSVRSWGADAYHSADSRNAIHLRSGVPEVNLIF